MSITHETHESLKYHQEGSDDTTNSFWEQIDTDFSTDPEYADTSIEKMVAMPEKDSNPQIDWPESNIDGTISEGDYNKRLNYRLSNSGFLLDAVFRHLDDAASYDEWLNLKALIIMAKSRTDYYNKVDIVIEIEAAVYDFAVSRSTTMAEFEAAKS